MNNNLYFIQNESEARSYHIMTGPTKPIGCVIRAMEKYLSTEEISGIIDGYKRSTFSKEALIKDIMSLDVPPHKIIRDDIYTKALLLTSKLFKPPNKCKPVHYLDLEQYNWTLDASVELPFSTDLKLREDVNRRNAEGLIENRRMTFGNLFEHVFKYNRPIVHQLKQGVFKGRKFYYNMIAHARSHLVEAGSPDKIRLVYGVPKLIIQVELMLLWSYMRFLRNGTTPIAWGYEIMNGGLYRIAADISTLEFRIGTYLCLDWSQFDKRMKFEQIDDVHKILYDFMDFESGYVKSINGPSSTVLKYRLDNLWKWMTKALTDAPLRLPDGRVAMRRHSSLASGLFQTQLMDSMVNVIMLCACLMEMGLITEHDFYVKVLGDDSLVGIIQVIPSYKHKEFLTQISEIAFRRFGAILNVDKSIISNSMNGITFLGYTSINARPHRSRKKLLAQLAYSERHWTHGRVMSRAIGIAYASVGCDRVVYDICSDVYHYLKARGNSPDPTGVNWITYIGITSSVDLSSFPSWSDVTQALILRRGNQDLITNKYWNPKFFLE